MSIETFIADVRLDESDEVLQLPIVQHDLKRSLAKAVSKIGSLDHRIIPSSDDCLEDFLITTGKFFGKDPSLWEQEGKPKTEVTEEDGKRYIKQTGTFRGTELHLFVEQPYYDERLPVRDDKPELNFHEKKIEMKSDEQWRQVIQDQPWTLSVRRQVLMMYLQAKLEADDGPIASEACHGIWELAINKENHADMKFDRLAALLVKLSSSNIQVATLAAAAVWGLATTGYSRHVLTELDVIASIVHNLKRSLKLNIVAAGEGNANQSNTATEEQRALMQRNLLGALAVLLIDRCCRFPYLTLEPDFGILFLLCKNLEGYKVEDAQARRETAAKVLTSLIQRDADARMSLVSSGSLRSVLQLINPEGPGEGMIQFCMASLLATLVLDDEVMGLIRDRGEAPIFFESCLLLLSSTMDKLQAELDRQLGGYYNDDSDPPLYDLALGVRLAEAASQAMWGSAHMCIMMDPIQVKMEHVQQLGKMGLDCYLNDKLPLSRVCHCVAACLATLASNAETAALIMDSPEDIALKCLISLVEVVETEVFVRTGHVKAAACAGVAFLACHPIGAKGDECMNGPHRNKLLDQGAFGALLRAALTSVNNEECDLIVQQAVAIALMYLSSMAGSVEPGELAMYSSLLMDSDNSEMIEFLMAGMWILLRNPDNRKVLGSSFADNPANGKAKAAIAEKLEGAVQVHDVNETLQKTIGSVSNAAKFVDSMKKSMHQHPSAEGMPTLEEGDETDTTPQPDQQPSLEESGNYATGETAGSGAVTDKVEEEAGAAEGAADGDPGTLNSAGPHEEVAGVWGEHGTAQGEAPATPEGLPGSQVASDRLLGGQGQPRLSGNMVGASEQGSRQGSAIGGTCMLPAPAGLEDEENRSEHGSISSSMKSAQASAAEDVQSKVDSKLGTELKENWGLDTLVTVGESWLPSLLDQDDVGSVTDIPVLKLFEFLVASICLFMIENKADPERRQLDMFRLSAPNGTQNQTWWTVDACAPEPGPEVEEQTERALNILMHLITLKLPAAWKCIQLSTLTLWNASFGNPSIERNIVEKGLCHRLMDLINTAVWPPSLRDTAAGLLEFMAERYSNMQFFPQVQLPKDIDWPYKQQPPGGMVPAMAAYINLINSKLPQLEYRGCHAIARMCFTAPYRSPDMKIFIRDAKAVAAVLGCVDALVDLMKRVNKRYEDILDGHMPRHKQMEDADEDTMAFQKDMSSLELTQDVYFVLFAALMNVSVLKSVQPMVARKGLLVLLGTNTFLSQRVEVAQGHGICEGSEEKLLHLCSSIIQNISLHPQNRTRLYKAELKGSYALEKMIEEAMATDEHDDTFFNGPYELPPISSPKGLPSPRGAAQNSRSHHAGAPKEATSPVMKCNNRTVRTMRQKVSPNGMVLNASVDSALARGTIHQRPKVRFPQIVEKKDNVWPDAPPPLNTSSRRVVANLSHGSHGSAGSGDDEPEQALQEEEQISSNNQEPRHRFLRWVNNTFAEGDNNNAGNAGGQDAAKRKKTVRRQMWDENGDWLDNEPETSRTLNRLLCKPLNQMWKEAPANRTRHGQARWEPPVSEYREVSIHGQLKSTAAKLLTTQLPTSGEVLLSAAGQLMTQGKYSVPEEDTGPTERPATRMRQNGRMAMTILRPNMEVLQQAQQAAASKMEEEEAAKLGCNMETKGSPKEVAPAKANQPLNLKICLGPQRLRQQWTFEDKFGAMDDPTTTKLTIFEHIEGSRVCQGLFPSYQLPNGKQTYMYYQGGPLLDEIHVDAVVPPPRPSTVPEALQQSMPLADVLSLIAKPPGSAPPFIPYKPVPYLVPLPSCHTLKVKHPHTLTAGTFGHLREDNLQLILLAQRIIKNQTHTHVEAIEVTPVEEREPWSLPMSIFKSRAKEADCRGFHDNEAVEAKMFERDWARACSKEKFTSMLCREHKANKGSTLDDDAMLAALHDLLLQYYQKWYSSFLYYSACSSGDPYHMSLNAYTSFLDECQIADSDSQFIKRSDCDTIFIVCNFQPDKKSAEAQVNLENAMMRYEFLEAIARIGIAKYGRGQATDDVVEAVQMLLDKNLSAFVPKIASLNTNDFRKERLYSEDVDLLLKKHSMVLKALYSRYRLKPPGGGLRTKTLKIEGWQQFMSDAHLIDSNFTLADANLAFLWSRMLTIDEIKDYQKYTSHTMVDFLEAIGRVADMKSLPSNVDLDEAGYSNILEWAIDKERMEGVTGEPRTEGEGGATPPPPAEESGAHDDGAASPVEEKKIAQGIFRQRESAGIGKPKTRPLYVKLDLLLNLIFRRLFYDPATPEISFNYDGLLKMIKKIDKDLGP